MIAGIERGTRRYAALVAAHPFVAAASLTGLVSILAVAFPGIDVAVSRLFYAPGVRPTTVFPLEDVPALLALRRAGMDVTRVATIVLLLALLAKIFLPLLGRVLVPTRAFLVVAGGLALGPGLLVNGFFKQFWSRPRPIETTIFDGDWRFQPAWVLGGDCPTTNCSFPSGESASAAWLLAVALVAPKRWRPAAFAVTLAWMVAVSGNRVLFGSHFLSDVLIAWGLVLTIVLALHELVYRRLSDTAIERIETRIGAVGEAIIALVRRRP